MRVLVQRFGLCALIIIFFAGLSAGADLESAKRAYHQGDFATAVKDFTTLAQAGNSDAQLFLGKMYLIGQGVPKDLDQAMKLLKASAEQGERDAQFYVGSMYLLRQKEVAEGVKWLRLSAEQGLQDAQLLLGKAYMKGGQELPRDVVQADMWLRLAAKDNKEFYQNELRSAERQMTADQIAKGKALAESWKPQVPSASTHTGSGPVRQN